MLAARKRLLIAESELNRAQLVQDWQAMTGDIQSLTRQARIISSLASASALLVGGLLSFRRKKSIPPAPKSSWWQSLLKGVQLTGPLWPAFCTRPKE
ncbi:MAG: hypothetical protein PHY43_15480 [Verrucomicrobiales bacterium]|nr:hypothetical protein [Verrucomicrobiales bacterium]